MDFKERTVKDLEKLDKIIDIFRSYGFEKKYPAVFSHVLNYRDDARHFFDREDYFTSFGAANYAYGHIDSILILEKVRDRHIL